MKPDVFAKLFRIGVRAVTITPEAERKFLEADTHTWSAGFAKKQTIHNVNIAGVLVTVQGRDDQGR